MPSGAKHKRSGGDKIASEKHTLNPTGRGGQEPTDQTREPQEQDAKKRVGQFSGEGEPPLMKK